MASANLPDPGGGFLRPALYLDRVKVTPAPTPVPTLVKQKNYFLEITLENSNPSAKKVDGDMAANICIKMKINIATELEGYTIHQTRNLTKLVLIAIKGVSLDKHVQQEII